MLVQLPVELTWMLDQIHNTAAMACGSVRMEWAFDGKNVWVLQLQQEAALSSGAIIVWSDGSFTTL